jgi:hypothetical protein
MSNTPARRPSPTFERLYRLLEEKHEQKVIERKLRFARKQLYSRTKTLK